VGIDDLGFAWFRADLLVAAEPDSEKSGNEAVPAKKSKRAAGKKTAGRRTPLIPSELH